MQFFFYHYYHLALRKVQNDLRHKVNDFTDLNVALGESNTKLEGELAPLKDTEAKLAPASTHFGSWSKKIKKLWTASANTSRMTCCKA
jgi:hypothetical protein